ncbi:MAG TPA: tetratricopeptide repeat protein [Steroidobacteraceae bacterium]
MSLIAELKRRNVFRVGVAYLALGWIVTQVTTTVAPLLHLPDWIGPVVLWIGVIGFPFVLLFSWIYELTPEGIKRESEIDRTQSITHLTARRLDYVVIALLVAALGLYLVHEFGPARSKPVTVVTSAQPAGPAAAVDRSVAVLPFVDMSEARDQEYFADGISEELLNLLAQVPQLRVIARTSSFSFKGKEVDIAEIASKLKVAHVLEGSIRKSGDKLRITAQLIRASDSSHLWSQTYDREMTDVFKVQDEIAAAVVGQLKVTLLGNAPKVHSTSPQAYALFLQGREIGRQYNQAAFRQERDLLKQALAIDPAYSPAWAELAKVSVGEIDLGFVTPDAGIKEGLANVAQALSHDPTYAPAYAQRAIFEGVLERDYPSAARSLEQALALDPANPDIIGAAGVLARRLGRLDLAIQLGNYQVSRDPVNPDGYDLLGLSYRYSGQLDKSVAAYRTLLRLAPDSGWTHTALGHVLMQQGKVEAALAEYQQEPLEDHRLTGLARAYRALGRQVEADAAVAELKRKYANTRPFGVAAVMAERGDKEQAFALLDKAEEIHDLDLGSISVFPDFASLYDDPRWPVLLQRLGQSKEQLAAVKFDVAIPQ